MFRLVHTGWRHIHPCLQHQHKIMFRSADIKKHLKLFFKLTCWETVCIKKSYYRSYILWDVFSFMHINIQTGQFYTQHVCTGYSPPTTHTHTHTHTHYRRNQLHWLKIIQSRASHYDVYSAMETSTYLLYCLYFVAYSQNLNENPS